MAARADVVVDATYESPTQHHNPMELLATVASFADGRVVIHKASQAASGVKFAVAAALGLDAGIIDVISPSVGGGFGQKDGLRHSAIVVRAAMLTNRPVKLVIPRGQVFHTATYRPLSRHWVRLAANRPGLPCHRIPRRRCAALWAGGVSRACDRRPPRQAGRGRDARDLPAAGMPPDAPFPAGLDDAVAVWRALTETHDPRRLALEGTSAGGNLSLALLLRCKVKGLPMPGAVALGSPAGDLTRAGDTMRTNAGVDNVVGDPDGYVETVFELYARGQDRTDPRLSPLNGDFAGLPPTTLMTGTRDVLLSDTVRVHRKLRQAGITAEVNVYEALSHAQFLSLPVGSPLGREIYGEVTRFFDTHLAP